MNRYFLTYLFILFIFVSCKSQDVYINSIDNYRAKYYKSFAVQENGPITLDDLNHIDFYRPKKEYQCDCVVTLTPNSEVVNFMTYSNKQKPYKKYAVFNCSLKGKKFEISAYSSMLHKNHPVYKNRLFIPFMDHTSGEETYGGGRYLDLNKAQIQNNKVLVDFNKAYNPWCAYSEGYNCPIPPRENHLDFAIEAGEKNYKGEIKVK